MLSMDIIGQDLGFLRWAFQFYASLMHSSISFLQNAPTQSLLSVVNGILDESVERKNEEIPHVWQ